LSSTTGGTLSAFDFVNTALFERTGRTSDVRFGAARLLSTKTTDMGDGFGAGMYFSIRDDAAVINSIAAVGGQRDGADNSGALVLSTYLTGTENERMRITSSGNVGIGTTTPGAPLTVSSSTTLAAGDPSIVLQGVSNTERLHIRSALGAASGQPVILLAAARGTIASPTAVQDGDDLGFYQLGGYNGTTYRRGAWIAGRAEGAHSATSSGAAILFQTTENGSVAMTERMRITGSGNVGIGTTSPSRKLTVEASGDTRVLIKDSTQISTNAWSLAVSHGSGSAGNFAIGQEGVGIRVSVTTSGDVGIGTSNPKNKLTVLGSIAKQTTTGYDGTFDNVFKYGTQSDLEGSGQNLDRWIGADATITAGGGDANKLKFRVYSGGGSGSPADVMTLLGNGNVGVGTVSPGSRITSAVSSGGGIYAIEATVDGTAYFQVRNNGVTYTQGGTVSVISTRDVKKNIVESPYSFDSLLGIKLRQFQYIDPLIESRKRLGLIVDEVENILPEAMNYNDEGKADSIAYSDVALTVAVTTMHELQKVNSNLLAELQSLRARVAALESK
jgi:hypothetical protein